MQYALINGERVQAGPEFKGQKGICEFCDGILKLRLPTKKIHHWYHEPNPNCDSWWEEETEWHRGWKEIFPKEWREVIHKDVETKERHRADLKTPDGLIVEFQNSPISSPEIISREIFYKKLVWVINTQKLRLDFNFRRQSLKERKIPTNVNDYCRIEQSEMSSMRGQINELETFIRRQKIYDKQYSILSAQIKVWETLIEELNSKIRYHKAKIERATTGKIDFSIALKEKWDECYIYNFTRKRKNWSDAKKQIFLDFGDNIYVRKYFDGIEYYKKIAKQEFVDKIMKS